MHTPLLVALIFSAAPDNAALVDALQKLPTSTNACSEQQLGFDYWPEGGLRSLICHGSSALSFARLQQLAGIPAFERGPHKARMNLNHPTKFGHYNPAFVRWLRAQIPTGAARRATQPIYDAHLRALARLYFAVDEKMRTNPEWVRQKRRDYEAAMARGEGNESMWELSSFMGPTGFQPKPKDFDWGGFDPNLQRTAVFWWLRRDIDGSRDTFTAALTDVILAYDLAWFNQRPKYSVKLPQPSAVQATTIADAWRSLGQTKSGACSRVGELAYDYWPDGGMRNFYCRVSSVFTWQRFLELSPSRPFLSGPHGKRLNLNHPTDFGRYNPDFVRWLSRELIPAAEDSALRRETQPLYDQNVRELARIYHRVWREMNAEPDWLRAQLRKLSRDVNAGKVEWHRYAAYEVVVDELDPNLQRGAVLFWLRRSLDETAPLFAEGLEKLLRTYDSAWLNQQR